MPGSRSVAVLELAPTAVMVQVGAEHPLRFARRVEIDIGEALHRIAQCDLGIQRIQPFVEVDIHRCGLDRGHFETVSNRRRGNTVAEFGPQLDRIDQVRLHIEFVRLAHGRFVRTGHLHLSVQVAGFGLLGLRSLFGLGFGGAFAAALLRRNRQATREQQYRQYYFFVYHRRIHIKLVIRFNLAISVHSSCAGPPRPRRRSCRCSRPRCSGKSPSPGTRRSAARKYRPESGTPYRSSIDRASLLGQREHFGPRPP